MLPSTLLGTEPGRKRRLCVPWAFHSSDWHTLLVYYQHTSHIQYTHRGGRSLRPHLRLCFGHTTPYAHAAGPFGRVRKSPLVAILATSTVGKKAGPGLHRAHNAEVALLGKETSSFLGWGGSLSLLGQREVGPVAQCLPTPGLWSLLDLARILDRTDGVSPCAFCGLRAKPLDVYSLGLQRNDLRFGQVDLAPFEHDADVTGGPELITHEISKFRGWKVWMSPADRCRWHWTSENAGKSAAFGRSPRLSAGTP